MNLLLALANFAQIQAFQLCDKMVSTLHDSETAVTWSHCN